MSDIFREIDEEVRRDKAAAFWARYGRIVVAVAVLLVAAVAGWQVWQQQQRKAAEAVGAKLESALKAARDDRGSDAETLLADLEKTAPAGYRLIARFRLAAEVARRDPPAGAAAFEALAADASLDGVWRDLARLRAGMLKLDLVPYAEVKSGLEPLVTPTGLWRHSAREMLGIAALKAGNYSDAGLWFDQALVDPQVPAVLRQRIDLYLAIVRGGPVKAGG